MVSLISIQLNSKDSVASNLAKSEELIAKACEQAAEHKLVVLPECFSLFGASKKKMLEAAEILDDGPIQVFLSDVSKKYQAYVVAGTTPILPREDENEAQRYYAASLAFSPSGKRIACYNKIHLFDVEVNDNTKSYKESASTIAGKHLSIFKTPFAEVAQTVCYDLRFADMFSAYAKYTLSGQAPEIIVVPSAFTKTTGAAHWHALLKARSIENQCYIIAPNQVGMHADNRHTFGNSCIYSPWGDCTEMQYSNKSTEEGFAICMFDKTRLQDIRLKMPVLSHKKERYTLGS